MTNNDKIWLGIGAATAAWLIAKTTIAKDKPMNTATPATPVLGGDARINSVPLTDAGIQRYDLAQGDKQLSPHFKLYEFASRKFGGGRENKLVLHPALIVNLERLREKVRAKYPGAICQVNSGYRTAAWNKNIGGETQSRHMYGLAADIVFKVGGKSVPPSVVATIAESMNFGGVGRYNTFTHVDINSNSATDVRRWSKMS